MDQNRGLLAWLEASRRFRTPSIVPEGHRRKLREPERREPSKFDRSKRVRTALGFLHDTATTAPCHSPSFVARSRVATARARRRCVRPTSATQIVKDEHPYNRYLPILREFPRVVSMSCAVHATATRFGSSHSVDRGRVVPARSSLRVASDVSSFYESDRTGRHASEEPRTLPPPTRESRRLSTSRNAFCRQPSPYELRNDTGTNPLPLPALFRPKSVDLELDRAFQSSRNRVDPFDRSATCRFLQAAESTSTPCEPPNLAAA